MMMLGKFRLRRVGGFTLIELLVVVSILALLIGILLPSLRNARSQAKRVTCGANLKGIGIAMQGYLTDFNDIYPHVSQMPSYGPSPLSTSDPIYLTDVLGPYTSNDTKAFECPDDRGGRFSRDGVRAGRSYFETERSSYQYGYEHGSLRGRTIIQMANRIRQIRRDFFGNDSPVPTNTVWVMRGYQNFHDKGGSRSSRTNTQEQEGGSEQRVGGYRNYLYADGHVGGFES